MKVTVLLPCEAPKPDPSMDTNAPTGPPGGFTFNTVGAALAYDEEPINTRRAITMLTLRLASGRAKPVFMLLSYGLFYES